MSVRGALDLSEDSSFGGLGEAQAKIHAGS